ncbi:MAG: leucine-rich repeat protein [Prevotella sp.]|nr:leucine-rich repeat protein [Prevotella sp.]
MKKFTLVLFTLLALLPQGLWAAEKTINGVTYRYESATATVIGVSDNTVTSITIPSIITVSETDYNVTVIGDNAFKGCTQLTNVIFEGTSFPTTWGTNVFNGLRPNLKITFDGIEYTHQGSTWNNGDIFKVTGHTDSGNYTIINAINNIPVREIAKNALGGLSNKTVTIPENITTISNQAFTKFTNGSLDNANRLSNIIVSNGNTKFFTKNGALYSKVDDEIELITCPVKSSYSSIWADGITSIGPNAFLCHRNLSSITIPATVKTIGESAFNLAGADASALNITLVSGSKLEIIGRAAFQRSGITHINLEESKLKEIGEQGFMECLQLTSISFPSSFEKIGASAFSGCKLLENLTFNGTSLKTISGYAFYNCKLYSPFRIPDGVVTIQQYAFNVSDDFNSELSYIPGHVKIPASVTTIHETAFPYGVIKQHKLNIDFEGKEWATYYSMEDLELPDGLEAHAITGFKPDDPTKLNLTKLSYIHKEEAILLHKTGSLQEDLWCGAPTEDAKTEDNGKKSDPNIFKGSVIGIKNFSSLSGNKYVLENDQFVKVHQGSLPPFRCYIVTDEEAVPASVLYINDDNNTIIIQEEGKLINKNNTAIGSVSLSDTDDGKKKLTVIPGELYYAYKNDITIRKNTTAAHGRAPSLDNTTYSLTIVGNDQDPDPSKTIEYTFDPKEFDSKGATAFEITVNFHKCKSLNNTSVAKNVELSQSSYTYDGKSHKPNVTRLNYDNEEVNAKNYNVGWVNNINAGTGIVRITGEREFIGTLDKTFSIGKRDINLVSVKDSKGNLVDNNYETIYTGNPIFSKDNLTIEDIINSKNIIKDGENGDYDVSFENITDVSIKSQKARINIVSKAASNYKGTKVIYFTINPKDLTGIKITIDEQPYTGDPITPTLVIKDGELTVDKNNYDAVHSNNINVGTATVDVTFKGNYTGTTSATFQIVDNEIERGLNLIFNGTEQWATYYASENLRLVEGQGLNIFVITGLDGTNKAVVTKKVNFIPKNTAVLLQRTGTKTKDFKGKTMFSKDATLPAGVTPNDIFQGTVEGINDLSKLSGNKFVLVDDKFVQAAGGKLEENRCYLNLGDATIEGVIPLNSEKDPEDVIKLEEGKENKNAGKVEISKKDGIETITVTPISVLYAELNNITVVRSAKTTSARAPQFDDSKVTVTAVNPKADPSGTTQYKFNYKEGYSYQITVDFQKRIDLQKASYKPVVTLKNTNFEYDGTEHKPDIKSVTVEVNGKTETVDPSNYEITYDNNVNAGKGKVIITGKRYFMNTKEATFDIKQRDISKVSVTPNPIPDQTYRGTSYNAEDLKLTITDIEGGKNIIKENDYTIKYIDNKNAGKATVVIESQKINYKESKDVFFNILPKDITETAKITEIEDQAYTGSAIKPDLVIMDGEFFVTKDDYDAVYSNNVEAGTATINITFKRNYSGTSSITFQIKDAELPRKIQNVFNGEEEWATYIRNENISIPKEEGLKIFVVTGFTNNSLVTQEVNFIPKNTAVLLQRSDKSKNTFEGHTMPKGTKLDGVTPNTDLFIGTTTGINDLADISGNKFVLFNDKFMRVASGTLLPSRCYLNLGDTKIEGLDTLFIGKGPNDIILLEEGKEMKNIGTASLAVTGDLATITVIPNNLLYATVDNITVVRNISAKSARAPKFDDNIKITAISPNSDPSGTTYYTFKYEEGYNYQVIVDLQKRKSFQNNNVKRVINLESNNFTYDGTEKRPKVISVTYDGEIVDPNNYTISYQNNVNAGSGEVHITGKCIFTSDFHSTFSIKKRSIKLATIEAIPNMTYNGEPIKPNVVIKDIIEGSTNNIITDNDYELVYINNINVGNATVTIKSKETNYTSQRDVFFNIIPKNLSLKGNKPTIEPIKVQYYTGEPIKPELVIKDGNLTIPADNYDVEYSNNINEGEATVNITFKGNYKGTAKTTFKIEFKEERKTLNVDFGNDEWITYYSPIDLKNVEGLNIFVVTGLNKGQDIDLKTEAIKFIPKNIGVLLQRTDNTKTTFTGLTMPSNTTLKNVTPDTDLFRGTSIGIEDMKTIDGIKYILVNDRFIQTIEGPLPANRCYVFISNDDEEGINHVEGDDANGIIILEEGESSKTAGTVTVSKVGTDGYKTITITPASVLYATKDEIRVVRSIKNSGQASSRNRAPGIENTLVEVIPVKATADPSKKTQYKFKYDKNYNYQVTVNFKKRIDLSKPEISNPVVTLNAEDIKDLVYDGKAKTPRVDIITCNGTTVSPSYYTVTYQNNTNAGKPRVIITGKGFLMGSTHAEFSIGKRDFSNVTVKEPIPDQEYTGNPIIPTNILITDMVDGVNIVNDTDYELICENNIEVGTAKVTVKPVNNYYGSWRDYHFNIIPATGIDHMTIDELEGQWFDLNGQRINRPTQKRVYILRDKNKKMKKVRVK